MTEYAITARATWTGSGFALTIDAVTDDEGGYFIGHNDEGARLIESLRGHGLQVVDGRQAFFETLGEEPELLGEATPIEPTQPLAPLPPIVAAEDVHVDFSL